MTVIEQLSLEGIELPYFAGLNPGLARRRSDRSDDVRCHLGIIPAPVRCFTQGPLDKPLVSIYTLGRFSLLLNGEPAEFGR